MRVIHYPLYSVNTYFTKRHDVTIIFYNTHHSWFLCYIFAIISTDWMKRNDDGSNAELQYHFDNDNESTFQLVAGDDKEKKQGNSKLLS